MGTNPIGLVSEGERYEGRVHKEKRPYEDTARQRPSASQGERPWGNQTWHLVVLHVCHCWHSFQWQKCRGQPRCGGRNGDNGARLTCTPTPVCLECLVVSSTEEISGLARSALILFENNNVVIIKKGHMSFHARILFTGKLFSYECCSFSIPKSWKYLHSDWLVGRGLSKCKCISYHSTCIPGNTITTKASYKHYP